MQVDHHELKQFRVSSAPYAKSGELDAFLEAYGRSILRFEIEPVDGHPLQFDFVLRSLPDFAVASGVRSPMHIWRTKELVDNDDILLVVVTSGAGELGQHGRVAAISDGVYFISVAQQATEVVAHVRVVIDHEDHIAFRRPYGVRRGST